MSDSITPQQLREWRLAHGLSQNKLGRLLDVAGNTIYEWEAGRKAIGNPRLLRLALSALEQEYERGNEDKLDE